MRPLRAAAAATTVLGAAAAGWLGGGANAQAQPPRRRGSRTAGSRKALAPAVPRVVWDAPAPPRRSNGLGGAAAVAGAALLGAAGLAIAAGRYGAGAALAGDRPAGFGDADVTVLGVAGDRVGGGRVTLGRTPAAELPGTYALAGPDGTQGVVGPPIGDADPGGSRPGHSDPSHSEPSHSDPGSADPLRIVRHLDEAGPGLRPGARLRLTPQLHTGTPAALGLTYSDVEIPSEAGTLPAWFVPATRTTWVIAAHGLGASREQVFNVLPALHRTGLPVLALGYRGDPGAPDAVVRFGHDEWRDLDAAVRYALGQGARHVVLYGWSTGATMALFAAERSAVKEYVSGLVLDSPVLDWRAAVRALAAERGLPRALARLAELSAEARTGLDSYDEPVRPALPAVPTLVIHGPGDTVADWAGSRALVAGSPDLATLHPVAGGRHAALWNVDPAAYEETLRRFLTPLL
ncbi:alpha/beta hydrolase [Streptomyces boninensis]|uniref:alpha/beta hydrolase n=1 Tax=Streptomyces boninensis TaxID=2039455 RepID=UPI003B2201D4